MWGAFFYLLVVLLALCFAGFLVLLGEIPILDAPVKLTVYCGLWGGVGGVLYCMRGIYLNACVYKRWDDLWIPWYYIRPVVSCLSGVVSCVFLRAGLIVLEAERTGEPSNLVFFALAFIAGLNVDKFIEKLEDLAQVTWGIKKSRASKGEKDNG